ncbi:ATP-binding protein [Patulibacter brassicae]|uniref:histidine kinase n=1 Tax=Patulibacter brassicae TaxID=1705717 RepID=A0ABU4VIU7_9ACTN|nr:ATP-binding protein [Patulibacter brassicae]MDX8151764.1 ATP-binding protein [Patulibacter brassicae]
MVSAAEHPSRGRALRAAAVVAAGVGATTGLVAALDPVAPAVSLGVLYVVPVLVAAATSGLVAGLAASVLAGVLFDLCFLQPTGTLTIADGEHWAALAVLFVVAVAVARITGAAREAADRARAARRDADLLAELSRVVLGAPPGEDVRDPIARRLTEHLGRPVRLADEDDRRGERDDELVLDGPGGRVGRLLVTGALPGGTRRALQERIAPALAALLEAARERERFARAAIEAAAVRRSDELKTTLLRSVGHDLRTPLTQVTASAAALREEGLEDADRRELADGIVAGGERLAAMIDKLLDLSRLEAGTAAPRPALLPLDDVVRDALDEVSRSRQAHDGATLGERIRLEVQDPVPTVRADAAQLTRALVNLVENALLHGRGEGPGGDALLVRVVARRGHGVVRVIDRGPGIGAADQERLFAPFERGAGARGPGSGLGLAIARGFVEAAGGTLRVESYPGQGAAFVVELPLADDDAAAREPEGDEDGAPGRPTRDPHAVEDASRGARGDGPGSASARGGTR